MFKRRTLLAGKNQQPRSEQAEHTRFLRGARDTYRADPEVRGHQGQRRLALPVEHARGELVCVDEQWLGEHST